MSNLAEKRETVDNVNIAPVPNNVVGINNESASVKILNYLEDKKRKSENTHEAYNRYYKEFFKYVCNKEISQVTWEDVFKVDYSRVDDYKNYLLTKGIKPYYVEQKLFACKSLWEKLYHIDRNIDMRAWDFEREEYEENHYAALSDEEMNLLFDFSKQEEYKPKTKEMYFKSLYIIGCRKNVPLELEWNKIIRKYDKKNKVDLWVVKFHDKGKWVEKAINDDFYEELLELKTSGESTGDRVFDINKNTIESVFDRYQEKYNLYYKDGERITIHSIKKASGWLCHNAFGDLYKTQRHMQHKDPKLTAKVYLQSESYADQASYMMGKRIDPNFFRELDKEDLIKLIESRKDIQIGLYYEWEKIK